MPQWWKDWKTYTLELSRSNVRLRDRPDQRVWAHAESGSYSPKFGYKFLMSKKGWGKLEWWAKHLWKLKCPPKARLFFRCILKRKIPTWDILQARYKSGQGRCLLCKNDSEKTRHLFIDCPVIKRVWSDVGKLIQKNVVWEGEIFSDVWQKWWHLYPDGKLWNLPPIIAWSIWIARNWSIFLDKDTPFEAIAIQCTSIYTNIPKPDAEKMPRQVIEEQIKDGISWAFFNGASQNNRTGVGLVIHINQNRCLKASVGLGTSTNNFVELSALKLLLYWLIHRNIFTVQIFGESMNVIKWFNGQRRCQNYIVLPLLEETKQLEHSFNVFSLCHIYREHNDTTNRLSKEGLQ